MNDDIREFAVLGVIAAAGEEGISGVQIGRIFNVWFWQSWTARALQMLQLKDQIQHFTTQTEKKTTLHRYRILPAGLSRLLGTYNPPPKNR